MPELPEVEHARRQLAAWALGRVVLRAITPDPGVVRPRMSTRAGDAEPGAVDRFAALVAGQPLCALARHGKRLGVQIGDRWHLLHLGMTGRLLRRPPGDVPRFGRLGLDLGDTVVWLDDARRFGGLSPLVTAAALADGLGPDALLTPVDSAYLAATFRGRQPLKVALLDQAKLAGLGNIHVVEALFRAGIHPSVPGTRVAPSAWQRLATAIPTQLEAALALEPAPDAEITYVSQGGPNPFLVYGRVGEPCARCGVPIVGERMAGRSTAWCPACQALPGDGRLVM